MYRDRLTELKGNYNYNQVDNRSNNYGNSRNNGYSPVNGNGSPPDSPPRNRGGNDVASQYAGRISTINNDIKALWQYVDKLDSLYSKNYNEIRRNENIETTKRINELEGRVTAEIQKITNQLKGIKSECERITNPRDRKMVLNQVNNASNNLKKVFDVYSDKRMKNMEQGRNKMIRQYQILNENATLEEAERYVDSHPGGSLQFSMLSGSKYGYDEAQQRRDQMEQINQSINELCDLFQDMNNMLMTQNETINIIEDNINQAEYCVEDASKQLTEAIKIRKSSRKKLWIITIIILILLTFLLIFILGQLAPVINFFKGLFGGGDKGNNDNGGDKAEE